MEFGDIQRFQMLDLNNISSPGDVHHHRQWTASPCNGRVRSLVCTSSTGFSIKRPSVSPSSNTSDLQEPPTKRLALSHPSDATAVGDTDEIKNDSLDADSTPLSTPVKVKPSPPSGSNSNQSVLNRTLSDNISCYTPGKESLNSQPVEFPKIDYVKPSPPSGVLNRTFSDNMSCCTPGKEALNAQPVEFSKISYVKPSPPSGALNRTLSDNMSCCTPGKEALNAQPVEFSKINYVKQSPPLGVLNRTLSDNISCYAMVKEAMNSQPGEFSNVNYVSPSLESAGTYPPLPPVLHRSISEPIPSYYLPETECPTSSKTSFPPSSGSDMGSADARRLRRMKERMKQMNQWMQKVADDDDEEDIIQETVDNNPKKMPEKVAEEFKPNQEAVAVEENGDNLILHFNCPCSKGYEIIISGKKCYYRLM